MEFNLNNLHSMQTEDIIKLVHQLQNNLNIISNELKSRNLNISIKNESTNNENRKRSLIIYGVEEEERENIMDCWTKVVDILTINMNIEEFQLSYLQDVRRIGKPSPGKNRPIQIILNCWLHKYAILNLSKQLRGTKIWIHEDYTKEEREIRRKLIPHMMKARNMGATASLTGTRIKINGRVFNRDEGIKYIDSLKAKQELKRTTEGTSQESQEYIIKNKKAGGSVNTEHGNITKSNLKEDKKPETFVHRKQNNLTTEEGNSAASTSTNAESENERSDERVKGTKNREGRANTQQYFLRSKRSERENISEVASKPFDIRSWLNSNR